MNKSFYNKNTQFLHFSKSQAKMVIFGNLKSMEKKKKDALQFKKLLKYTHLSVLKISVYLPEKKWRNFSSSSLGSVQVRLVKMTFRAVKHRVPNVRFA